MPSGAPLLRLLLFVLLHVVVTACADIPDSYALRFAPPGSGVDPAAQGYVDPTFPLPPPPPASPTCTVPVLSYSFNDTYGEPPAKAAYAPPAGCPAPWSLVVLSFSAASAGDQHNRVAAVWLDGAELLRTTTAEPTPEGVQWTVRKDVTAYSALLLSPPDGVLSVMLENVVNDVYTGEYNVSVSFEFHGAPAYISDVVTSSSSVGDHDDPTLPESYLQPADLILPISEATDESGYWFRIQNSSDSPSKLVTIPSSTYRAVLEVFVSAHADDEFWYSNPPDLYIQENNLTTRRGNAAYREVVVSVDRHFAGSFVPFPVIYTGGINPFFWRPVAALGAFNLPTYKVELTPFLGFLADGKSHEIGFSVVDGIAEWRIDGNLHLWLDPAAADVHAALSRYRTPRLKISRRYFTQLLDAKFSIRAKRKSAFTGWVKWSRGNFTTEVETELEATSEVEFADGGRNKTVRLQAEQETEVRFRAEDGRKGKEVGKLKTETKYPLRLNMETDDGGENDTTTVVTTSLTHTLSIETEVETKSYESSASLVDEQTADGWMAVKGCDVVNGSAATSETYRYSDDRRRYERMIDVVDGAVQSDNVTESLRGKLGWAHIAAM